MKIIKLWLNLILFSAIICFAYGGNESGLPIDRLLELGDQKLASQDPQGAITFYEEGVAVLNEEEDSLIIGLSIFTNLGSAYSSLGDERKAMSMYRKGILFYVNNIDEIVQASYKKEASDLAAQASFFLGMTLQELDMVDKAADAYAYANTLDENHWASLANLGSVLQDNLKLPGEALEVYNKAYDLLTKKDGQPTDPPEEPRYVLSQLQYRIGLAITYAEKQKCALHDNPSKEVPCSEMAAHAFNYAIELDPSNENAKHMLASVTADATMSRASNTYVTQLFEDYAGK
jgi:tetratricopeptide (TPR) repeat protein